MSATAVSEVSVAPKAPEFLTAQVMAALHTIRATATDGAAYGAETKLTDAGFTSMEMVNVMLAVEGAFDLTIPQNEITPANFATPAAIAAMVQRLKA